ncbi:hypothetical protein [uncultured Enterococcus sp.]|uniref:hypothetical protein n=1 Tax=uncultured Enterococcus sp. TaxID=167972 RepID=UPI0026200304|nr:hypothetical protein [uncultured Enterococcus sp.]
MKTIRLKDLKERINQLSVKYQLTDDTPIFLDTGWESLQEIESELIQVVGVELFEIEDIISGEKFSGYKQAEEIEQKALIIKQEL